MTVSQLSHRPRAFYFWCVIGCSLLATVIHLYIIHRYASGMPYRDDFDAIFGFLNPLPDLSFTQKFLHLFSQNNEHRIFLDNLISLSMVKLTGRFDFVWMIWIGNLGWFLIVLFFWKYAKSNQVNLIEFSPILIGMMCLSHYELMTMAMAGVQHYFQVFFCLLSIYFLTSGSVALALSFFICAIFTSGGGICVVPVIFLYYLSQKEWRHLFISVVVVGLVLLIYFPILGYVQPASHPNVLLALQNPLYLITYAFGFLGNIGNTYKVSIGLGIIFTAYLLLRAKFLHAKYPFLFWLTAYLGVTAVTNAITRGGIGIRTGQGSRYTTYSLILTAIVYLTCLLSASSARTRARAVGAGFFFSLIIFSYWFAHGQENIAARYNDLESGVLQHPSTEYAVKTLQRAMELGYYFPTKDTSPAIVIQTPK
ncbi:hypothetical protein [Polynucleobacter sp. MWH-Braz-FAM2G]|uniref:hypothetical protein n=1 Tax=Polynucleobacter sp. MWH-Braz-FAM2G TaxID=1855883 RepID=UPI001BFE7D72|nr:hypothetical protein [Polynucleobacter sp. MWH-Braz-FAM2G]QWD91112.1 hypothetical protein FD973_01870 [Polynucleobacter sp. MWH-Braz-FAM2G]